MVTPDSGELPPPLMGRTWMISNDARESRIITMRITKQCAELEKRLQAQDEQSIKDRLSHLRRLLDLPFINEKQPKTQYEDNLHHAFEFNKKKVPKYRDVLKVQIVHKDWESDKLERKTKFLQELLNLYSAAGPVYLVFDNVKMDNEASTTLSKRRRPVFIKRLLELVRDVQGVVKILLVGLREDFDEVELDILRDTVDGLDRQQLLYRLAWDSATLPRILF
ncbi:MAG: hypothetical protein Q9213_001524 [Squamulea squamosa]